MRGPLSPLRAGLGARVRARLPTPNSRIPRRYDLSTAAGRPDPRTTDPGEGGRKVGRYAL